MAQTWLICMEAQVQSQTEMLARDPALGTPAYGATLSSPWPQPLFCSKGNLENGNQASEPCLPLGPRGTSCHGEREGPVEACVRPSMRPKQRARIQSGPQEHLGLHHPLRSHLSRSSSFLSLFPLGPVGVMRLALPPFRVIVRIK